MSYRHVQDNQVCHLCIQDQFLRKKIVEESRSKSTCTYCNSADQTIDLGYLAVLIDRAFSDHYVVEYNPTREDHRYPAQGQELIEVIQTEVGPISDNLAEDLSYAMFDIWARYSEEGECPFPDDTFIYVGASENAMLHRWRSMHSSLLNQSRFLNSEASEVLKMIFDDVANDATKDGKPLIVEVGPGHELSVLYRARVFQNEDSLADALTNPEVKLGPPAPEFAASGRMNAKGISVFYGASIPEIALAEVRPPVGSRVAIAKFEVLRNLRLLDLTRFKEINPVLKRSMFDESTLNKAIRQKFIARLENELVKPVMPSNSDDGYLVTQVVADFLATHKELNLDGVIFRSIQVEDGYDKVPLNVVLFNKASLVDPDLQRGGKKIISNLFSYDEKGEEYLDPEISITHKSIESKEFWEFDDSIIYSLKLIPNSIVINEIKGVSFTFTEHSVRISHANDRFERL